MPQCQALINGCIMSKSGLLQDQWSSKTAFILAATGAAVGLGNIWRFPYMAGSHGGSAFVMLYLFFVLVMGMPILIAEIMIGRRARKNPVNALSSLAQIDGHSKHWSMIGWLGALALLLILSFYSVVSGWSIAYLIKNLQGTFINVNATQIQQTWSNFLANPKQLLLWHSVFMSLTVGVIILGVSNGLEKASKIMMPALYAVLIALVIFAATHGNFEQATHFLFDFNLEKINSDVVIAAMGHAFFTLALGAGAMLTYGAYMPKKASITYCVSIVVILDVLVAVLSGLSIFPLVFKYNLAPGSGPGLMFVTLPIAFTHMTHSIVIGSLFFSLLLFAAWTSSINLAEPMVIILMKRLNITRTRAALLVGLLAWAIGITVLLSFNLWQDVKIFGHFTPFDIATDLPMNILLPLGGLGFALFAGYIMSKHATRDELHTILYPIWRFLIRYIAPVGIFIVFIYSIF